jgi:hypothetical protein
MKILNITLSSYCCFPGIEIVIYVKHLNCEQFNQFQFDIYKVGIFNAKLVYGSATKPSIIDSETISLTFNTKDFESGIYEVKNIFFHSPDCGSESKVYWNFSERILFLIMKENEACLNKNEILHNLNQIEEKIEMEFYTPFEICRNSIAQNKQVYFVIFFVKKILISKRIRFQNFEIRTSNDGLDSHNETDFINSFLRRETLLDVFFNHTEERRKNSISTNPVSVFHFPALLASDPNEIFDFCTPIVNNLIDILSLSRDSKGEVFNIVIQNRITMETVSYAPPSRYIGNLFLGELAGENSDVISKFHEQTINNSFKKFIVNLYSDIKRESQNEFHYIQFWSILEIIAEKMNFNRNETLTDFDGTIMRDEENKPLKMIGSVNIVFNLFKTLQLGAKNDTWKLVNIAFAFRNAVAHHGSIKNYTLLHRAKVKKWAEIALKEQENGGSDYYFHISMLLKLVVINVLLSDRKELQMQNP